MVDGTSDDIKKVMSEAKRLAQRGGGGPRGGKSNESAMVNHSFLIWEMLQVSPFRIVGQMKKLLLKVVESPDISHVRKIWSRRESCTSKPLSKSIKYLSDKIEFLHSVLKWLELSHLCFARKMRHFRHFFKLSLYGHPRKILRLEMTGLTHFSLQLPRCLYQVWNQRFLYYTNGRFGSVTSSWIESNLQLEFG